MRRALGFGISGWAAGRRYFAHLEGPESLEGHWPWQEMEGRLLTCGREVRTSHDAGSYVCDSTYWALLAFRLRHGYPRYAAFLHVPPVSGPPVSELFRWR